MKKITLLATFIMLAVLVNAQQRKAGKPQQEFLIVKVLTTPTPGSSQTSASSGTTSTESNRVASFMESLLAPVKRLFTTGTNQ